MRDERKKAEVKMVRCVLLSTSGERAEVEVPNGDKLGMLYTMDAGKVARVFRYHGGLGGWPVFAEVEAREFSVTQVVFVADRF